MLGDIFDLIILNPLLNILVVLSNVLFHNFGLAIIVITVIVRGALYPLTMQSTKYTRAMSEMTPKIQEIQKKYANDKDKQAQEMAKIQKEIKLNPLGCIWPLLIQFPIVIALYQSIIRVMAVAPEDFLNLSHRLYDWPILYQSLPVNPNFLWFNLTAPDFIMAIIVGLLMYMQTKMSAPNKASGKATPAAQPGAAGMQARMTQVMMPLLFMMICIMFPSGLALYFAIGSLVVVIGTLITNKGSWGAFGDDVRSMIALVGGKVRFARQTDNAKQTKDDGVKKAEVVNTSKKDNTNETSGNKRSYSGGSSKTSSSQSKSSKKSGRGKRYK
ncbi:MAG: YidC/Oxa1 family membrane protein insertase [Chloroflexi bacterium]|nr:YidC/Oxa1 family membrane protein insertase [Chloroflexota bacterium]